MARGCTHGQSLGSILVPVGGNHSSASSSTKKLNCAPENLNSSQIKNKNQCSTNIYWAQGAISSVAANLKQMMSIKTKTKEL
jgi:hypothetical protein